MEPKSEHPSCIIHRDRTAAVEVAITSNGNVLLTAFVCEQCAADLKANPRGERAHEVWRYVVIGRPDRPTLEEARSAIAELLAEAQRLNIFAQENSFAGCVLDKATHYKLTELQYSEDVRDPRLYIYDRDGRYSSHWIAVNGRIRYPDEEITVEAALELANMNIAQCLDVKITNGDDHLIYQYEGGKLHYVAGGDPRAFWQRLGLKTVQS